MYFLSIDYIYVYNKLYTMTNFKWTYEKCKEEAKKYSSRSEFLKKSNNAYSSSWRNKWLDDFFPKEKITYEKCKEEAKKYKNRSEFKLNSSTYFYVAKNNNWINDFFGEYKGKKNGYWTYEKCKEEAKKYSSRVEFFKKKPHVYYKSLRNDWIKDFDWLKTPKLNNTLNEKNNFIYAYECEEYKTVYVGRTINVKKRHNQHNRLIYKTKKYDSIKTFFNEINQKLPLPKVLEENLTFSESQICEEKWVNYYINNNWNVLNKARVGLNKSSLGKVYLKWTYEKCKEESKKYNSKMDFKNGSNGAYWASIKNKWINDFYWLKEIIKPKKYWYSYERCKEEAKKYKNRSEFKMKNGSAYNAALKQHWLNTFFPKKNVA